MPQTQRLIDKQIFLLYTLTFWNQLPTNIHCCNNIFTTRTMPAQYMPLFCVCLCACFITLQYCIKMAKYRIVQAKPHDSPRTAVFDAKEFVNRTCCSYNILPINWPSGVWASPHMSLVAWLLHSACSMIWSVLHKVAPHRYTWEF